MFVRTNENHGDQTSHGFMADQKQLSLLKESVSEWNAWRAAHPVVPIELSGAHLFGAHLEGADLQFANLEGTHLQFANLREANLYKAHLEGANLYRAHLEGTSLFEANLYRAILERAILDGAILDGAHLFEGNLTGAHLERAHLQFANLERAHLQYAYLQRANLDGANLQFADLHKADLREVQLRETHLDGAILGGANFSRVVTDAETRAFLHTEHLMGRILMQDEAPSGKVSAELVIYLSHEGDLLERQALVNAAGSFIEALGFELDAQEEPTYGSWFQRMLFKSKEAMTSEQAEILFDKAEALLKAQYINPQIAKAQNVLADAAVKLLAAAEPYDEIVLRLGIILLVKTMRDGKPTVVIESLSPELKERFDNNPALLRDPQQMYNVLTGMVASVVPLAKPAPPPNAGADAVADAVPEKASDGGADAVADAVPEKASDGGASVPE